MKPLRKTPEMDRFNIALRQVMGVTKPELMAMLEVDRQSKAGKPKRGPKSKSLDRASSDKD